MNDNNRVRQLFDQVIQLPAPGRVRFLDEHCGDDQELRNEIEALVSAHDEAGSYFSHPVVERGELDEASTDERLQGQTIGRYRLDELIDEGGFGEVYLATQTEPVSRRVAVKVIKPGLIESTEAMNRFRAEQQALAILEHPSISRVLDAGEYHSQPYFVMEFVDGESLVQHCDEQQLSVVERVKLVREICLAVQHAHTKGVVHRDLKPSNVLVARVNDKDLPVVIDFGVAKLMSIGDEGARQTRAQQLIGTPAYASPEQFKDSRNVDTRSDVYSIGIMLYELLTGTTPLQAAPGGMSFEEIRHHVCEVVPSLPSVQVRKETSISSTTTKNRACAHVDALSRSIRQELDWIVGKAIEKDPNDRYQTMASLVDDLNCYLSGTPVSAHPQTIFYRSRKFVRKHWIEFSIASSALVLVASLGSWGIYKTIQANNSEVKKAKAETDALNAELAKNKVENYADTVNQTLVSILSSPSREIDGRTVTIAQRLGEARGNVEILHPDDPDQQAEFLQVLGETYLGLYLPNEAIETFNESVAKGQSIHSMTTKDAPLWLEIVRAHVLAGDAEAALQRLEVEVPKLVNEHGIDHRWHVKSLILRSSCHVMRGNYELAIRSLVPTIEKMESLTGAAQLKSEVAGMLSSLNRGAESIELLEEIDVAALERPIDQITILIELATAYSTSGQFQEGYKAANEAWKIAEDELSPSDPLRFRAMHSLALSSLKVREREKSLDMARRMVANREKYFGETSYSTMNDRAFLAMLGNQCGEHQEAIALMESQLEQLDRENSSDDSSHAMLTAKTKMWLAAATFDRGMSLKRKSDPEAEATMSEGLRLQRETVEFAKNVKAAGTVEMEGADQLIVRNLGFLTFLAGRANRADVQIECFKEMNDWMPDRMKPIEIPLNNIRIATLEVKQNVDIEKVLERFNKAFEDLKKTGQLKGRTLFVIEFCDLSRKRIRKRLASEEGLDSLALTERWVQTVVDAREDMVKADYVHQQFSAVIGQAYLAEVLFRKAQLLSDNESADLQAKAGERFSKVVTELVDSHERFRSQYGGDFVKEINHLLQLEGGLIESWKASEDPMKRDRIAKLAEIVEVRGDSK